MVKVFAKHLPCSHCGREGKTVAKGLCNACYYRLKKNGTLEYKVRKKPIECCIVEGCDRPVVSKEYCDTHHTNNKRFGDPVSNFGYGERSKHPLYQSWDYQKRRTKEGQSEEWKDFWCFVSDAGEKPSDKHHARRYDFKKPWGPDNFFWQEKIGSKENTKEYQRMWRKKNPLKCKNSSLKKTYGIPIEHYMEMYEKQQGKCAICGVLKVTHCAENGNSNTLAVDHCHDKGHIRALLCTQCNKGLGHFSDNSTLLQKAIDYLNFHKK